MSESIAFRESVKVLKSESCSRSILNDRIRPWSFRQAEERGTMGIMPVNAYPKQILSYIAIYRLGLHKTARGNEVPEAVKRYEHRSR